MKIEIKHRFSLKVIFSHECENNTIAITVGAAINAKADLGGADLRGADLGGADLGEFGKLIGDRPYFSVGPIGSRQDVLISFQTEKGIFLRTGCFFGTVDEFKEKLQKEHGRNIHATEYTAALVLITAHYVAFPPTSENENGRIRR